MIESISKLSTGERLPVRSHVEAVRHVNVIEMFNIVSFYFLKWLGFPLINK